jgi:putative ABC transport system ATP-binding protein
MSGMETSITRYIWKHTSRQQLWILLVVAVSMVPYFLSFDLPKRIVNGPIQGQGFEGPGATQLFMRLSLDLPGLGEVVLFPGLQLERLPTLFALSAVFLALVIVNGLFKFYINTYKGRLGERLLRRLRFELIDRVLRFPPGVFKRVKGAEIASMVKDEVEPLGGFTGDAFVSPALLGGQALTALAFIVMQNLWLGLITVMMVLVQAIFIPRLRRRLLVLGRERQLTARELAGRVGEIVDGIAAVHGFDTSNYERADIAARLGRIFRIRYDLYQWKFMVKFINNFIASLTPFLFYSIGGYLALKGRLDIGQLVAVIGAYKDLPGPLKDLIDWDQARQDVQIKYMQVVGQFSAEPMIDPAIQALSADAGDRLQPPLSAVNLTVADESGAVQLDRVNFSIRGGERVAIVGGTASGGEALAEAFGRLVWPASGRIVAGDRDILALPEALTGRSISYASAEAYFFYGTLRDNLLYGLKHAPAPAPASEPVGRKRRLEQIEAGRAGTPDLDPGADWIDYAAAGARGPDDLLNALLPVLDRVQMSKEILDLALRAIVDPAHYGDLAERIVALRGALRQSLQEGGLSGLIEGFDPDAYNTEATVGENLLFGNAIGAPLAPAAIGKNAYFRSVIVQNGLHRTLYDMGFEIARNAIDLFGDLPPDHPFFQQLTFMTADDLPRFQALVARLDGQGFDSVSEDDRAAIIGLSFAYIEPRHRFGLLTDDLMAKIVDTRRQFRDGLPEDLAGAIEFYDPARYTRSASLLDNVLFGRIGHRHADGGERVHATVRQLLGTLGLYQRVLAIGLDFHVGAGGRRLTGTQRQKLNLARALLRRSSFFVFNRPLPGLDQRAQDKVLGDVLDFIACRDDQAAVLWVLADAAQARRFDRVLVFEHGTLVEDGSHATLTAQDGIFQKMK